MEEEKHPWNKLTMGDIDRRPVEQQDLHLSDAGFKALKSLREFLDSHGDRLIGDEKRAYVDRFITFAQAQKQGPDQFIEDKLEDIRWAVRKKLGID